MFAQAFGTTPAYAAVQEPHTEIESLDTDSVLIFLTHLGASQHEVHKRIADSLQKELEDEIRNASNHEALLTLLKNCWYYATTVPELRPILWAVLKQLGDKTPLTVLMALAEDDGNGNLKHAEIFKPLPPHLKRLVWEADWDHKISIEKEIEIDDPIQHLELIESTLLYQTVNPLIERYIGTSSLIEAASKFFSVHERRMLTTQRRALVHSTTSNNTSPVKTSLLGKRSANGATVSSSSSETQFSSGKAVSQLRDLLSDTTSGATLYRPKLLHGVLSMLIAKHGSQSPAILTGVHLHCTLVADILLSAGGSLPTVYQPVLTLARALDDCVKNGEVSERNLIKAQEALRKIYGSQKDDKPKEQENILEDRKNAKPTTFLQRQLNRIIREGINAMNESDPQNLFLNPVTDAIAPGYSKVIKKPMCISIMEDKIDDNAYKSLAEWEADVKLMFQNCVQYNRGVNGKWFRDEAGRQLNIFKREIVPQARKLYIVEQQRRKGDDSAFKRKREGVEAPKVVPLDPISKKRKMDSHEETLSMSALASMLLADPFVVRLMLDHVLRSLRIEVLKGGTIPAAHQTIPSIIQLLHIAQWSTQICRLRGKRCLVPDSGLVVPNSIAYDEGLVPYKSMRQYLPVLVHLFLEAHLDKRLAVGGDLASVSQFPRPPAPQIEIEEGAPSYQVAVALFEGAFVHICSNSSDAHLSISFEKFSNTLSTLTPRIWEERAFFVCLVPAILRHKARLNRSVRDVIMSTWTDLWLRKEPNVNSGAMMSAAHEYFILLLNEWASFGNLLMPRDLLLKVSLKLVEAVNNTETKQERQFAHLWKTSSENSGFEPIKKQYLRMLSALPQMYRSKWLEDIGVEEQKVEDSKADDTMEE